MKFNLKNRPVFYTHFEYDISFQTMEELKKWFVGFEKELRNFIKEMGDNQERHWITIEEILGE